MAESLLQAFPSPAKLSDIGRIERALARLAASCDAREADRLCPLIARRIGLAEWIVRADLQLRSRQ